MAINIRDIDGLTKFINTKYVDNILPTDEGRFSLWVEYLLSGGDDFLADTVLKDLEIQEPEGPKATEFGDAPLKVCFENGQQIPCPPETTGDGNGIRTENGTGNTGEGTFDGIGTGGLFG